MNVTAPVELHIQIFTESRPPGSLRLGTEEVIVKVTDLKTGRVAYGAGERSQHGNRAKAIAELTAPQPSESREPLLTDAGEDTSNGSGGREARLVGLLDREIEAHEYFARNGDLRMTTGDHQRRASKLRAIQAELTAGDTR